MRIFKDCYDMIREIDRELLVQGITVKIKHYQNKKLDGEDQITKELIGVSFLISKPLKGRKEMFQHAFKEEAELIEKYCVQEHKDRTSGKPLNPGNSWKIRKSLWQNLMSKKEGDRFDYTYAERMAPQLESVVEALKDDIHSRRAMMMIWDQNLDANQMAGFQTRVPCSISYQFLIRNNRLYCVYYIRSQDFYKHFPVDIWQASEIMNWMVKRLKSKYKNLKVGSLNYFAGSLHAYNEDLKKHVVY